MFSQVRALFGQGRVPIRDRPFTERGEGPHILALPTAGTSPTKGRGIAEAVLSPA